MQKNDAAQQGPVDKTTHLGKCLKSAEQKRAFKKNDEYESWCLIMKMRLWSGKELICKIKAFDDYPTV